MSETLLPSSEKPAARIACATMLTGERYLDGTLVLGHSLRANGWTGETLALVTPDISASARQKMARYWDRLIEVENIANPNPPEKFGLPQFATMYTKLRIWELEEYSRLVYIDADAIVMGNLDDLKFENVTNAPAFAAAPCMWTPDTFSSGVLSIAPSRAVFSDMMEKIHSTSSSDGGDQGFLNNYFSDWFFGPSARRLPAVYNLHQHNYLYAAAWRKHLPELKILHFTGYKPWELKRPWHRKLLRFWLQRLTQAAPEGPSPVEIWWETRNKIHATK